MNDMTDILQLRIPDMSVRDKVFVLEDEMKKHPQVILNVKHHFSWGTYARELFIPKGIMLTGMIHKFPQMNMLIKGKMRVLIGEQTEIVEAPFVTCSEAGIKRVAWALEDSIWVTILPTHERDISRIEKAFVCNSEQEYLEYCGQATLGLDHVG